MRRNWGRTKYGLTVINNLREDVKHSTQGEGILMKINLMDNEIYKRPRNMG